MDYEQAREIMQRSRATLERLNAADVEREIQEREHRLAEQFSGPPNPSDRRAWVRWLDRVAQPEPAKVEPQKPKDDLASIYTRMHAHVQAQLEDFADMVGAEVGEAERQMRDQHAAEITGLRVEIAELRKQNSAHAPNLPNDDDATVMPFRMVGGNSA
jgi:hypothetical protein